MQTSPAHHSTGSVPPSDFISDGGEWREGSEGEQEEGSRCMSDIVSFCLVLSRLTPTLFDSPQSCAMIPDLGSDRTPIYSTVANVSLRRDTEHGWK